jgi:hypothetical protein
MVYTVKCFLKVWSFNILDLLINTVHNGESFYAHFSFCVQHLSSEEIPLHVQYFYAHCWTEFTAASTDQLDIRLYIASFVEEKSANVGNKLITWNFPVRSRCFLSLTPSYWTIYVCVTYMYYLCEMKIYSMPSPFPVPVDEIVFMIHAFGYTVQVTWRVIEGLSSLLLRVQQCGV